MSRPRRRRRGRSSRSRASPSPGTTWLALVSETVDAATDREAARVSRDHGASWTTVAWPAALTAASWETPAQASGLSVGPDGALYAAVAKPASGSTSKILRLRPDSDATGGQLARIYTGIPQYESATLTIGFGGVSLDGGRSCLDGGFSGLGAVEGKRGPAAR